MSTINIFPFLQSNSENYLLGYDRPHSFFLEPAAYCTWILPLFMYVYEKKKAYLDGIYFDKHFIIDIFNGILMTGVIWLFYAFVSARRKGNILIR